MRIRLAFALACASALAAASAAADGRRAASSGADGSDHDKAAAAFKTARSAIAAGNCASAVPKLEESLAFEPSVGAHLSLADCYEQVDLVAAWRELQQAADLAASKNDARETVAHERAVALEPRLSMLRFAFAPAPSDVAALEVRVDGNLVKPFLLRRGTLPASPGGHEVEVSAPHKKKWQGHVVVRSAGTVTPVEVSFEDEAAPVAPAPPVAAPDTAPAIAAAPLVAPSVAEEPPRSNGQRTAAFVATGVGGAGIALGAVFGVIALAENGDLRSACGGSVHQCKLPADSPSVTSPQSAARSASTVSTVAFIAGGAALAAGIVLFATAPSAGAVKVGAAAGPGGGSLFVGGRFE